jgi:hypothetical protein
MTFSQAATAPPGTMIIAPSHIVPIYTGPSTPIVYLWIILAISGIILVIFSMVWFVRCRRDASRIKEQLRY